MTGTIVISENPIPVVDLGADTTLCPSQSITLLAPAGTGYIYDWVKLPDDTLSHVQTLTLDTVISGMGTSTYELIVTDNNTCVNTDTIIITFDVCISVAEYSDFSITVFPNPAKDNMTIVYQKLKPGAYTVEVANMLSQVVLSENVSVKDGSGSYLLNVNGLSKGVYNLSFSNHKTILHNLKVVIY